MSTPPAVKAPETPPSSDVEITPHIPPTPTDTPPASPKSKSKPRKRTSLSSVDRLVSALRLLRAGKAVGEGSDWQTFHLSRAEFAQFERRLEADSALHAWYCDKARYDWEAQNGRFVLRMPTAVHERFIARVEDAIGEGIAGLAARLGRSEDGREKEVAVELNKIYKGRSTTLEMRAPRLENSSQDTSTSSSSSSDAAEVVVRRSPDATFYHPAQPDLPCLVVEVSYSQQRKELPRLAESYVIDSRHAIRCVLALDISYPAARSKKASEKQRHSKATLSVWRAALEKNEEGEDVGVCHCDVDEAAFRDADGSACNGALTLRLGDILPPHIMSRFAPSSSPPSLLPTTDFSIPFADLAAFLSSAQSHQQPSDSFASAASASSTTTPKRFRKRKRTPSEELSDEREAEYTHREEQELEKERKVDGEWRVVSRWRDEDGLAVGTEKRRSRRRRRSGRGVGDGPGS